jgi:hypothetical protein
MFPFVPEPFDLHGVGDPRVSVPVSTTLPPTFCPFVHLSNVFPLVVVDTDLRRTESLAPPKPGMLTELPEIVDTVRLVAVGVPLQVVLPS